jgi:Fe-S-cluster containining protein
MPYKSFVCRQCGNCCINVPGAYDNSVSTADVRMWQRAGRDDILAWIQGTDTGHGYLLYRLWFDPETGLAVTKCPWLLLSPDGRYSCRIHDLKPKHCRDWPHTREDAESSCGV